MAEYFTLQSIDPAFGCSVLSTVIPKPDIEVVCRLIGIDPADDPDGYVLDPDEARAVANHFGVAFEPSGPETIISRFSFDPKADEDRCPYLVHTGWELFLMLDGRKPFASFGNPYPPVADDDPFEESFEPYVLSGRIVKRVVVEIFDKPITGFHGRVFEGVRKVFYALPGEEWRIDANTLLWQQLKYTPWNEALERIWGKLLGYANEEIDWWIRHLRHEGLTAWGMAVVYAAIEGSALEWVRASGCRALPWNQPGFEITLEERWPRPDKNTLRAWMEFTSSDAIIRFRVQRNFLKRFEADSDERIRQCRVSEKMIPALNACLSDSIEILAERERN